MTKQEYFKDKIKGDFIKYVMLRKPFYSDEEISKKLKSRINSELLYDQMKKYIPEVIEEFLSTEKLKDEKGNLTNELPDYFTPDYPEKIVNAYREKIDREYTAKYFLPEIIKHIERLTWVQGVDDMIHNLRQFMSDLRATSSHLSQVSRTKPEFYNLKEKYEAARKVSLREHLMRDNYKDIVAFNEALANYCRDLCGEEMTLRLSMLYSAIADSDELKTIISNFESMYHYALQDRSYYENLPVDKVMDAEYYSMVPIDFYERNLEDVDAPKAFMISLLQLMAQHENELKKDGCLTNEGEIEIFTNPDHPEEKGLSLKWLDLLF